MPYPLSVASSKPVTQARNNHSRPLRFILDTGSPGASINRELVGELGLQVGQVLSTNQGGGGATYDFAILKDQVCEEMGGGALAGAGLAALNLRTDGRSFALQVKRGSELLAMRLETKDLFATPAAKMQ